MHIVSATHVDCIVEQGAHFFDLVKSKAKRLGLEPESCDSNPQLRAQFCSWLNVWASVLCG